MRNLDWFDEYVMNEIPIRLIRLSDMKFFGRSDVKKHFRGSVPEDGSRWIYSPSDTVKYAILSHRWLDEGEPTFEEMKSGKAGGPGAEKLGKFCEKAREYNVEFAWSDTCCIDKSSSTELDESIRSMFRWYRNSEICIVHLAQSETMEDVVDDEWTQRAWTLQELLAPYKIKLFNKHWMPMTGNQHDKEGQDTKAIEILGKATGISLVILYKFRPGSVRVDERMTWAARRKATRVEDVAYSLMGIFDVSLQIAYGEGGDRAFCRLIEAIMQAGDRSVLSWTGGPAKHPSSSAIPQSPQSFKFVRRIESGLGRSQEPLEMTMTSLGLRVPLVIFPLIVTSVSTWDKSLTAKCLVCPAIKIEFFAGVGVEDPQFALGIVNYSLQWGSQPQIRGESTAFILQRNRIDISSFHDVVRQPRSGDFVGLKTDSSPRYVFTPWKKVYDEGLIDINFPNILSDSYFFVSREYLEFVYL
jgi:hypothetical protein